MSYQTGRFRRADRVLSTREFTRAFGSGKRRTSASFVVVIAPKTENTVREPDVEKGYCEVPANSRVPTKPGATVILEIPIGLERMNCPKATARLGVTVSKRVGNSVIRNHLKRCIREWFRHARAELPTGSDILVVARSTARSLSSCEVAVILDEMTQHQHGHLGAG